MRFSRKPEKCTFFFFGIFFSFFTCFKNHFVCWVLVWKWHYFLWKNHRFWYPRVRFFPSFLTTFRAISVRFFSGKYICTVRLFFRKANRPKSHFLRFLKSLKIDKKMTPARGNFVVEVVCIKTRKSHFFLAI